MSARLAAEQGVAADIEISPGHFIDVPHAVDLVLQCDTLALA